MHTDFMGGFAILIGLVLMLDALLFWNSALEYSWKAELLASAFSKMGV